MDDVFDIADDPDRRPWSLRLRGRDAFLLGGVSLAAFLWTKHPAVGAVFPLLVSGRRCWNVGWWLYDRDPDRRRATAVLLFYLAWAGWQAAAAAFATFACCIVLKETGWLNIPEERLMWTCVVLLLGLVWNAGWCFAAMMLAYRRRLKIWLSPGLVKQCGGDFAQLSKIEWNPRYQNRAVFVIASGVALPVLVLFSVALSLATWPPAQPRPEQDAAPWLGVTILLAMPLVSVCLVTMLVHRLSALSPSGCWGQTTAGVHR